MADLLQVQAHQAPPFLHLPHPLQSHPHSSVLGSTTGIDPGCMTMSHEVIRLTSLEVILPAEGRVERDEPN